MHHKLHRRRSSEAGFTLIELLVVILIIGILAAIALPAFLRHRSEAEDAKAKENARNMVSQIEACYHNADGYLGCDTELTPVYTGLPVGTNPGEVHIGTLTTDGYIIEGISLSHEGGTQHKFTIVHNIGNRFEFDCNTPGHGGCGDDGHW